MRERGWLRRASAWGPIALIKVYQWTLSPLLGGQCRFHPTCSRYAEEAFREHGLWRGGRLTVLRLVRCHPFSKGGYDPVPVREEGVFPAPERPERRTDR
jgi:putative membrane protein insertion efficiency factor